jgi:hypothetical protein
MLRKLSGYLGGGLKACVNSIAVPQMHGHRIIFTANADQLTVQRAILAEGAVCDWLRSISARKRNDDRA